MAAVAYLKRNPDLEHAPIRVCFTVDEEVAGGADHLELERYGAKYAYTLDGSELGEIEAETFNASKVTITIRGRSTHPGTAKGQLVNAVKLAADLDRRRCRATAARPRRRRSARASSTRRRSPVAPRRRRSSSSSATTTLRRCKSTSRCSAASPTR